MLNNFGVRKEFLFRIWHQCNIQLEKHIASIFAKVVGSHGAVVGIIFPDQIQSKNRHNCLWV